MAKPVKAGPPSGGGGGSTAAVLARKQKDAGKSGSVSLYLILAVFVGIVAWFSLGPKTKKVKKFKEPRELSEAEKLHLDRLQMVKDALISEDGRPAHEADGKSRFADPQFWEERYTKSNVDYDWYGTWNGKTHVKLKPHVQDHLPSKDGHTLVIGCGSSVLARELLDDGYTHLANVDISSVIIEKMKKKFEGVQGVDFQVQDVTSLTYKEGEFDLVIDKGTLDALYTGATEKVKLAVSEAFRVLRPGGVFVSMSFGAPKKRKELNATSREDDAAPPGWGSFHIIPVAKFEAPENPHLDSSYFYIFVAKKLTA